MRLHESKYHDVSESEHKQWVQDYIAYNGNNIPADNKECTYITRYKGEQPAYYRAINAVESMDPFYLSRVRNTEGEGFEETSLLMSHGLKNELKNYSTPENLVLYTGTKELNIITGLTPNMPDLVSLVGKEYTFPMRRAVSLKCFCMQALRLLFSKPA